MNRTNDKIKIDNYLPNQELLNGVLHVAKLSVHRTRPQAHHWSEYCHKILVKQFLKIRF